MLSVKLQVGGNSNTITVSSVSNHSTVPKVAKENQSTTASINNNDLANFPPRSPTKKSPKKRKQVEQTVSRIGELSLDIKDSFLGSSLISSMNQSPSNLLTESDRNLDEAVDIHHKAFNNKDKNDSDLNSSSNIRRRGNVDQIPTFYIPGSRSKSRLKYRTEGDFLINKQKEIESIFKPYPDGILFDNFVTITKKLCGIPSFFNRPMCQRIYDKYCKPKSDGSKSSSSKFTDDTSSNHLAIKFKPFIQFWVDEIEPYDKYERFFRIIKHPNSDYIVKDDFIPFLQQLLIFHPGLYFLENHEEFKNKYALAVITRIFYSVNISRSGKISLKELRNSNLVEAFLHVDEDTDINRAVDYFSYEHFYVLYCKFFELDTDRDFVIHREDLVKYADHSLSECIVDRIFQVGLGVFDSDYNDRRSHPYAGMTFSDFVFFSIAEEDKSSIQSLQYWFKCVDLDGDGVLSPEELRHFYKVQLHRINSLDQEPVNFADVLCQMIDMINPVNPEAITFNDVAKPEVIQYSGILFDCLFNLNKFIKFETRDPFAEKIKREDTRFSNDWERFALFEYQRLAKEEEDLYESNGYYDNNSMDIDSRYYSGDSENNPSVDNDDDTIYPYSDAHYNQYGRGGGYRK